MCTDYCIRLLILHVLTAHLKTTIAIKIDHHPDRDVYGAISFVIQIQAVQAEILCRFYV